MRRIAIRGLCMALLAGITPGLQAQERPPAASGSAELAWLDQLAGEWQTEGQAFLDPTRPPIDTKGTESARKLGDSWVVSRIESSFMGTPFSAVFTLGYDAGRRKFVGTWIDSASRNLWHYEGTLEPDGKTLTLAKVGACGGPPAESPSQQDVIAIESARERTLTSRLLVDGKWTTMITVRSRRTP